MKNEINPVVPVSLLMILVGTLSPSNGIDDSINKTPLELISSMLLIVSVTLFIYMTLHVMAKNTNLQNK